MGGGGGGGRWDVNGRATVTGKFDSIGVCGWLVGHDIGIQDYVGE